MGTPKRERQKANRQQRLIEEAKAERSDVVRRNTLRWGIGVVAAIGAVLGIAWVGGAFGGDDDETVVTLPETVPSTAPDPTATTLAPLPAPEKPEVELPSNEPEEVQVTTLIEGEGPTAVRGDTVVVYYVGVLSEDGTEFDSNYEDGPAFPVTLGETAVIEGWSRGLFAAQRGERRQIDIPAEFAYGSDGRGEAVPPDSNLTFVVDVVQVVPGS